MTSEIVIGSVLFFVHVCAHFFFLTMLGCAQGYTIPLDKRLAADGRGLQTVHINENFAKLAEALYIADRKVTHDCQRESERLCFKVIVRWLYLNADYVCRPERPWRCELR